MTEQYQSYTFHAFLRTVTPLHIGAPDNLFLNTTSGELQFHREGGTPATAVQKLSMVNGSGFQDIPMIAANNIAGHLRRHAAALVLQAVKVKGQQVKVGTFNALHCGAVTGKPDKADLTFEEYRETRAHPYAGLFGGGPSMLRRYVRPWNSVPYRADTAYYWSVNAHPRLTLDDAVYSAPAGRLTRGHAFRRLDDLRDLSNIALATETIENFEEEFRKRQELILGDIMAKKLKDEPAAANGDGPGPRDIKPSRHSTYGFHAYEYVPPGIYFPLKFELNVSKAQMGLFLRAIDRFAAEDRLGGFVRNGFGVFAIEDVIIQNGAKDDICKGHQAFNNGRLEEGAAGLAEFLGAWDKAAAAIEAADLDRLVGGETQKKRKAA